MIESNIRVGPNAQIPSTQKPPIKVKVFFSIKYLSVEPYPNFVSSFQEVIQTKDLLKIRQQETYHTSVPMPMTIIAL